MRRRIAVSLIAVFFVSIVFFQACGKKEEDNVIKIGANLPLTGEAGVYGQNVQKGMKLALDESEIKHKIKILFEDNKGNSKDAVIVANKIVNEGVIAVIDDAISGISLATISIYTKSKVPLISTGSTSPALSGISPFFFRIWNSDEEEGKFAAESALNKLQRYSVVILYLNSDYGLGLKNVFEETFVSLGGKIVKTVAFDEGTRDYRATINKFKNESYDLIYIIGYAHQTGLLVKSIREQKINKPILSTVATEDQKFIELAGDAAEGVIYVFNKMPTGKSYNHFISAYKNKYNEKPQILTDVGYDAMKLILMAVKSGARTGIEVKEYLAKMDVYEGASGLIKFDEKGNVHKPMILKTIKDKSFIKYK